MIGQSHYHQGGSRGILARAGFTLLELVIVTGIILIAAALLVSSIQKVRELALGAHCSNNLRQVGLACHHFNDTHGRMPPALDWFPGIDTKFGAAIGPIFFHLLPFIEQGDLYRASHVLSASPPQDYFDFAKLVVHRVPLYDCPLDPSLPGQGGAPKNSPIAASSYAANFVVFGRVDENFRCVDAFGKPKLAASFPDGTSHTILFGEKYAVVDNQKFPEGGCHWDYWGTSTYAAFFALHDKWTDANAVGPARRPPGDKRDSRFQVRPRLDSVNPSLCASGHSGGMNVCFADGTVRTLAPDMDKYVWWALVTPAGGE